MKSLKLMGLSVLMIFSTITIYSMETGWSYKGYEDINPNNWTSIEKWDHNYKAINYLTDEQIEDYRKNSGYENRIKQGLEISPLDKDIMNDKYPEDKKKWMEAVNNRSTHELEEDQKKFVVFERRHNIQRTYDAEVKKIDQECNDNRIKLQKSIFFLQDAINNTFKLDEICSSLRIEEKKITKELLKAIIMNTDQEALAEKNIKKLSKEFNNYLSGRDQSSHTDNSNNDNRFIIESIKKLFNSCKNYFCKPSYDIIMTIKNNNKIKRDNKIASQIPAIEERLTKAGINPQYVNIKPITKNDDQDDGVGAILSAAAVGVTYDAGEKKFFNINNAYTQSLNIDSICFYVGIDPLTNKTGELSLCNIVHEIQHLKEAHSIKTKMLELYREHYKKTALDTDEITTNTIDVLMNKFNHIAETIADTLPFIKDPELALCQKQYRAKNIYMDDRVVLDAKHYKTLSTINEIHERNRFIVQNYLNFNNNIS